MNLAKPRRASAGPESSDASVRRRTASVRLASKGPLDSVRQEASPVGFAKFIGPVDIRLDYMTTDRDTASVDCALETRAYIEQHHVSALYNLHQRQLGGLWRRRPRDSQGRCPAHGSALAPATTYSRQRPTFSAGTHRGCAREGCSSDRSPVRRVPIPERPDARIDGHTVEYNSSTFSSARAGRSSG